MSQTLYFKIFEMKYHKYYIFISEETKNCLKYQLKINSKSELDVNIPVMVAFFPHRDIEPLFSQTSHLSTDQHHPDDHKYDQSK